MNYLFKIIFIDKILVKVENRRILYFFIIALTISCSKNTSLKDDIDEDQAIAILKEAFTKDEDLGHFMELPVGGEAIEEFLKEFFNDDTSKIFNKDDISLNLIELQKILFGSEIFLDRLSEFFIEKYKGLATKSDDPKILDFVKLINDNSNNNSFPKNLNKDIKTQEEIDKIVLEGLTEVFELARNADGGDTDEDFVKQARTKAQLNDANQFDESQLKAHKFTTAVNLKTYNNKIFDAYTIVKSNYKDLDVKTTISTDFSYKEYDGDNKEILLTSILEITSRLLGEIKKETMKHNTSFDKYKLKDLRKAPFKTNDLNKNWNDNGGGGTSEITLKNGRVINLANKYESEGFEHFLDKWAIDQVDTGDKFDDIFQKLQNLRFNDLDDPYPII